MNCPKCKGMRFIRKINLMSAATERIKCDGCHGTGFIPEPFSGNGVKAKQPKCITVFFEDYLAGIVACTAEVRIYPALKDGKPVALPRSTNHPVGAPDAPALFAELVRIKTVGDMRRKGHARACFEAIIGDPKIQYVITDYDDSTPVGRKFCRAMGFKDYGGTYVWARKGGIFADVFDAEDDDCEPRADIEPDGSECDDRLGAAEQ